MLLTLTNRDQKNSRMRVEKAQDLMKMMITYFPQLNWMLSATHNKDLFNFASLIRNKSQIRVDLTFTPITNPVYYPICRQWE